MDLAALERTSSSQRSTETVTFQQEQIADICQEVTNLLIAHWKEVAFYKDIPLNPDMGSYLAREASNSCVVLTVRADKALIGYIVYLLQHNLHYRVLEAVGDLHFLHPDYRRSGIGLQLLRFGEAEMRKRGVKVLIARTKANPKLNHGAIFERLGYDCQDIVYTKRLDHGV